MIMHALIRICTQWLRTKCSEDLQATLFVVVVFVCCVCGVNF